MDFVTFYSEILYEGQAQTFTIQNSEEPSIKRKICLCDVITRVRLIFLLPLPCVFASHCSAITYCTIKSVGFRASAATHGRLGNSALPRSEWTEYIGISPQAVSYCAAGNSEQFNGRHNASSKIKVVHTMQYRQPFSTMATSSVDNHSTRGRSRLKAGTSPS